MRAFFLGGASESSAAAIAAESRSDQTAASEVRTQSRPQALAL